MGTETTSPLPRILISACRFGQPVRYDGGHTRTASDLLDRLEATGCLIPFCPEVAGGAQTPRPSGEILGPGGGDGVLDGNARVVEADGTDVTSLYVTGARLTLDLVRRHGITHALLQDRSPSCGSSIIYDGHFSGNRHPGHGVTTALLRRHGVTVFADLDALVDGLDLRNHL